MVLEVCNSCVGFVQLSRPLKPGCLPSSGNSDFTLEPYPLVPDGELLALDSPGTTVAIVTVRCSGNVQVSCP